MSGGGPEALLALAAEVAGLAGPGEQVEAYALRGTDLSIRVSAGEVEQLSSATSEGVGVRVVKDGRVGFAWAGSLDPAIVRETLADARDNASFATPDEHAGLAQPDGVAAVDLDLWRDDVAATATDAKIAMAAEAERRVLAAPGIRGLRFAEYQDGRTEVAVATSTGIAASRRSTNAHLSCYAMAGEGDGTTTGAGSSFGRSVADLDVDRVVDEAVTRATRMQGAAKPKSALVTVVLDPSVAASVLSLVASLGNGEGVLKGRSLFAGRLGEEVASPLLTLVEDPTNPSASGASAYDAEGLATRRTPLIEGGVLRSFLYDTRWGRAAGVASTASATRSFKGTPGISARAVAPAPGTRSHDEIVSAVGDGLYVQSVSGLHSGVDRVSGDFSVGCEGLMIRGGALAEPVKECTIASTLLRMLQGVVHVGGDLEWGPGSCARLTLAIDGLSLGGT
jgi:PmbA protein